MRFWLSGAALLFLSLSTGMALAQSTDDQERARQHFVVGQSYFEQSRFTDAAREFREAYFLSRRVHLLKNVATSYERAGEYRQALQVLEEYLSEAPEAEDRRQIEGRMEQLRQRVAEQEASADEVTDADRVDTTEEPTGEGGEPATVDAAAASGARGQDGEDQGPGPLVIGLLVGSGVTGVAALVTGLLAHGTYSDLEESCPGDVCPASMEEDRDSGQTMAVVSTVLTGVAVTAGVVGAVLWLAGGQEEEQPTVSLGPGPGLLGASATARF